MCKLPSFFRKRFAILTSRPTVKLLLLFSPIIITLCFSILSRPWPMPTLTPWLTSESGCYPMTTKLFVFARRLEVLNKRSVFAYATLAICVGAMPFIAATISITWTSLQGSFLNFSRVFKKLPWRRSSSGSYFFEANVLKWVFTYRY